jgi:predicted nucleic acid-binding protein
MILVDTSVWVDHLRVEEPHLVSLLSENQVFGHPMVIGELACGNLRNRDELLQDIKGLPTIPSAAHDEVFYLIEDRRLRGRGIGFVDAHLLASTALAAPAKLWTKDMRLLRVAVDLRLAYDMSYLQ